jgi:simple sugar transport system ATP-binding protein
VIFITHNVHHAYPVGDAFTILNRGRTYGTFQKDEVSREEVLNMMAGGKELDELSAELEEFSRTDAVAAASAGPAAARAERAIAEGLHREAESLHKH